MIKKYDIEFPYRISESKDGEYVKWEDVKEAVELWEQLQKLKKDTRTAMDSVKKCPVKDIFFGANNKGKK